MPLLLAAPVVKRVVPLPAVAKSALPPVLRLREFGRATVRLPPLLSPTRFDPWIANDAVPAPAPVPLTFVMAALAGAKVWTESPLARPTILSVPPSRA